MKKRIMSMCLAAVMAGTLMAGAVSVSAEENDKYVIGVSISGYQAPYFVAMVDAMENKAEELGNVELKVLDAENDAQKQASQVESLIDQKCDLIMITPFDSKAIVPTMKKVYDAGIPLFDVNAQHDDAAQDYLVTFVGASMEDEAAMAADSLLNAFGEEECNVVIIEGAAGTFPAIHRTEGFLAAIEGHDNINVLANQNCGWDRPTAQTTMDDFLTRYDDIDAVYAHDDNMAIGVIQSLKAAGRLEDVQVFSISGTQEGVAAIKAGEMVSTVDQSPTWEGEAAVEYAVRYLEGEEIDNWIKTPIAEITADNADEFSPAW